ncbi:MAG: hypothetical protein J6U30_06500, partial [Oscillospiraceae bacterium]|nr:hypothetical protein [Oscillospiraceae bacterium]
MEYTMTYTSPLSGVPLSGDPLSGEPDILLAACPDGITGLWFMGQKHFPERFMSLVEERSESTDPRQVPEEIRSHLDEACHWLDIYFSGQIPDLTPALCP